MNVAKIRYPELAAPNETIYTGSQWGEHTKEYYTSVNMRFRSIAKRYNMPVRIPYAFFKDLLSENDLVVVLLENIDCLFRLQGKASSFG